MNIISLGNFITFFKIVRNNMYVSVSKLQGILMSKESDFENMGTVFSSLEILQEPEIRKIS